MRERLKGLARLGDTRMPTSGQLLAGSAVAIVVAQVVLLGLTGQGSPQPFMPSRWRRGRHE